MGLHQTEGWGGMSSRRYLDDRDVACEMKFDRGIDFEQCPTKYHGSTPVFNLLEYRKNPRQ